jgi:NADH dehydrogenase
MKLLILGGSGFVGCHLARRLSRDAHVIDVATRYAPRARRLRIVPGVSVRQFDPYDVDRLAAQLAGHDAVINLVGMLNERGRDGSGFRRAHVEMPEVVIEACRRSGVRRLLHMSALNAGRSESRYLATRGEGERRVKSSGLDWTLLRPSAIFGPDDRFLKRFERLLRFAPVLPLARPAARLAPVYVGDVAEAFARALTDREAIGRTFELCGPEIWRLREIAQWVAARNGWNRWVVGLPDALGRLQGRVFDFVPGKPFSSDNFRSLGVDGVCGKDGFTKLGISPWAMTEKACDWLGEGGRQDRFRRFRQLAGRGGRNE